MGADQYETVAKLLDSLYETEKVKNMHRELREDSEISRLRNAFLKKYAPEKLERLSGYELLSKFFDLGSDSLIHCIALDENYKVFGSARHTSNNIYPVYKTEKEGWCTKERKSLSNDDAIAAAAKFRNKFVACMKQIETMPLITEDDYEKLGNYLNTSLGDQGERVWIHKYLHMIFPDKFSEFHSVDWKKYLLCALQIRPRDSFYGMAGQLAQIQQRMNLKDYYKIAHVVYDNFPEIGRGGICRLTFKHGLDDQVKDWNPGERVNLKVSEFEGNIRKSKWFYGASERERSYLFVVENTEGKLLGVAGTLSGEPENGKRFDERTGIWYPCFSDYAHLPIADDSDVNATISKVDNILYVYKHYYSFYHASSDLFALYEQKKDQYKKDEQAFIELRQELLSDYPALATVLTKKSLDDFSFGMKGSFLRRISDDFKYSDGIHTLSIIDASLDNLRNEICMLILTCDKGSDIEKIESISLSDDWKLKILSIYYPNEYIGIADNDTLSFFLEVLNIRMNEGASVWSKQRAILCWKKEHIRFEESEISNYVFIRLLYDWQDLDFFTEGKTETRSSKTNREETQVPAKKQYTFIPADDPISKANKEYDDEYEEVLQEDTLEDSPNEYDYGEVQPKNREIDADGTSSGNTPKYKRDPKVAKNALAHARYRCECNPDHETFIRKNSNRPYTESHHLIPMKYSEQFEYSLDREVNIVSLCSYCHNLIHYGKDADRLIRKLYKDRAEYLEMAGIGISEDELLKLYGN